MDLELRFDSLGLICVGCLSTDRKIRSIIEIECRNFFNEILDPFNQNMDKDVTLCWECEAIVRKIIKFKRQVRMVHHELLRYSLESKFNIISSLSSLTTAKQYIIEIEQGDDQNFEIHRCIKINDIINDVKSLITEKKDPIDEEKDSIDCKMDLSTIVKVEGPAESENNFEVSDDFYDNDHHDNKADLNESKNYKNKTHKLKRRKRKTRKKKNEESFNDSDDEPLKPSAKETDILPNKTEIQRKKDKIITKKMNIKGKNEKQAGVINNIRVEKKLKQLNIPSGRVEMVLLSWEEVEAERQKALESVTFTRHDYRCYDCAVGFNHKFKLENHMMKHDPSSGDMICEACKVRCKDAHSLSAHRRRHRLRWRCVLCGSLWSRACVAADHQNRVHGAHATHACPVCSEPHTTLSKLRSHLKKHSEKQKCEICGKMLDKTSLKTHLFIHRGEKEYSCSMCDKKFLFKKSLELHLVSHDAPAQLYCHECDVTFKNHLSFYQHMKYNKKHIDPAKFKYTCEKCDKKFVTPSRLNDHNLAVHLKLTPIQCTMAGCNFACSSRPALRGHIRTRHRNVRARRNHVCDTCGKAYTTKKTLEGHIRSHTGERPFKCKHCPSTFGYDAALYNHNKLVHFKMKNTMNPSQSAQYSLRN